MSFRASLLVVLCCAPMTLANLDGIPLQQHARYKGPPPGGNPNQGGTWTYIKNDLNVGLPTWEPNGTTLTIPNSQDLTKKKDLWLEVDYLAGTRPAVAPNIPLPTSGIGIAQAFPPVAGVNDWTYHWLITPQPQSEQLSLPPTFFTLQGIDQLEIGTNCTPLPEPTALAGGGLWLIGFARRNRKGRA